MILPDKRKDRERNLYLFSDNLLSSFFYTTCLGESIGSFVSLRYT